MVPACISLIWMISPCIQYRIKHACICGDTQQHKMAVFLIHDHYLNQIPVPWHLALNQLAASLSDRHYSHQCNNVMVSSMHTADNWPSSRLHPNSVKTLGAYDMHINQHLTYMVYCSSSWYIYTQQKPSSCFSKQPGYCSCVTILPMLIQRMQYL